MEAWGERKKERDREREREAEQTETEGAGPVIFQAVLSYLPGETRTPPPPHV